MNRTADDESSRSARPNRSAPFDTSPSSSTSRGARRRRGIGVVVAVAVLALVGPDAGHAAAEPLLSDVLAQDVLAQQVLAQAESVDAVLTNVRNWIIGIAAGLATVFVSVGAVRYMAAGGDLGEVEKAKSCFRSALLGYGLALLTPLVLTVLREIVGAG